MKLLRSLTFAAVTATALLTSAAPAAAQSTNQSKVAVIDVRRAVLETEQGLRVQATLKKLFDSRQVELDGKQRQLQADKEALDKEAQSGKTSKDALAKKYENLQRQAAELQNTMMDYQREMQRKESEMTTPILQGVLDAVKRIAAQEGFEMVMEKSAVPYFRGDLELTDRAIQLYNSGNPAPKAPADKPEKPGKGGDKPADKPAKPAAPAPAPKT
ncbi:MAG: OmpH family outer membrane protein [Byssovorax sp.]